MPPKGTTTAISTLYDLGDRRWVFPAQAARIMDKSRDRGRRETLTGRIPAQRIGVRVMIPAEYVREHIFGNHQHEQARRRGQATRQKAGQRTQPRRAAARR